MNKASELAPCKQKRPACCQEGRLVYEPGDFLLSHTLARAVPSGLRGLTAVFGMGTGGALSLGSPEAVVQGYCTWETEYRGLRGGIEKEGGRRKQVFVLGFGQRTQRAGFILWSS